MTQASTAAPRTRRGRANAPRRGTGLRLIAPVAALYTVLFFGPMVYLVAMSLWPSLAGEEGARGFSFDHYADVLGDSYMLSILWRTVWMGLVVTLFTLLLGFPVAYGITRAPERWRTLLLIGVVLPFLASAVVRSFGWMVLFAENGLVTKMLRPLGMAEGSTGLMYTMPGLIIAMVHVLLPIMILVLYGVVEHIDHRLEEAAANLGATRTATFFLVIVPNAIPGILAGSMITLTLAMSSFVTPALIAGPRLAVVPTAIYDEAVLLLNLPGAGAMSVVLLLVIVLISVLYSRLLARLTRGGTQ